MTRLACLALLCALAAPVQGAPAFSNLDWSARDGAGKPQGWQFSENGIAIDLDCAPACALRFTGPNRAGQHAIAVQWSASVPPAGQRLVLTGRVRTERLDGQVHPHLTAIVNGRQVISESIGQYAGGTARIGSTDWREFSASLPVVPGTTGIGVGVLVSGRGTAWVDRLAVRVEDVVRTGARQLAIPYRPQASQVLEDDDALRLPAADIPAVSAAWRADVQARRQPIRSLFSDDFSDLQFLKPLLEGKRVVQLGESSHGVAEFNWMKVRLAKFLHQELGYDVIAFESSLAQCFDADGAAARLSARELLRHCAFAMWDSAEVLPLFEYLKEQRAGGKRFSLAGFDTQPSASLRIDRGERLQAMLAAAASPLAADALTLHAQLAADPVGLPPLARAWFGEAAAVLERSRNRLINSGFTRAAVELQIQALRSNTHLLRQAAAPRSGTASDNLRDIGMAENLNFLLDTLYPGRKVIVWAHNAHIAYDKAPGKFTSMGAHLAKERRDELYTVGLYMGRGVAAHNDGTLYPIDAPLPGTLEAVLANGGAKYSFVDFSASRPVSWPAQSVVARDWGTVPEVITPARAYDALLYIDTVTPPDQR